MPNKELKQWFRLDTAALIFPAILRKDWANIFRLSVTLKEEIDPEVLKQAVEDLEERFPSFYVRLRRGMFWFYLEGAKRFPDVREDFAYPLTHMGRRERAACCLRVFYYKNRIAIEVFHAVSDGTGGSIYLQTLLNKYLELKYGLDIPSEERVIDWDQQPKEEELEDSFIKNSPGVGLSRSEETSYRLHGTEDPKRFRRLICGTVDSSVLHTVARSYDCTITVFLAAVMAKVILNMQDDEIERKHQKPVKITLPVNLRKLYGSKTLRNFVLALNIGVDPRLGEYTLQELCDSIKHQLSAKATPQYMAGMIGANVLPQKNILLRFTPLTLKSLVMAMVYSAIGERKGCISISNLGVVKLPQCVQPLVDHMDFIIGPQIRYPNNCSVISCNGKTRINMISLIQETTLEQGFFSELVDLGIPVEIESNRG